MKLLNTDWLQKPQLQRLFSICENANVEMRCVGGCVRDSLLGETPKDIDCAINIRSKGSL